MRYRRMGELKKEIDYYLILAEKILYGITDEQLMTVARYQQGRSFEDITRAIRDSNRRKDKAGHMMFLLFNMVLIGTTESLENYRERLSRLERT